MTIIAFAAILRDLAPAGAFALLAIFPLALWLWTQVAPRLCPPLIIFEVDGLTTRALGKLRWSEIAGVSLAGKSARAAVESSYHALILEFVDGTPRKGSGWYRHHIAGVGDHQEKINLVNSSENKVSVRTLAEFLVQSAESERRAALDGRRSDRP